MNNIKRDDNVRKQTSTVHRLSDDACELMITENGKSSNEKAKTIIFCGICKMEIQERSKKRPQLANKFITIRNKTQQNDITEIYCVPISNKQRTSKNPTL